MKRQTKQFKPNHEYLMFAVTDYLMNGGKITKLQPQKEDYEKFMSLPLYINDEFLIDEQEHVQWEYNMKS